MAKHGDMNGDGYIEYESTSGKGLINQGWKDSGDAVSLLLMIFQPVLFDVWCTLCLASAVISLLMIGPALDEFLASLQYLKTESSRGRSACRAFWGLGDGWG